MARLHLRKDDTVLVTAGADRGKTGRVLRVFPKERKAIVEGVRFVKKHVRPNPRRNVKGGIVEKEAPIAISNLMVVCPECSKASRTGFRFIGDGHKARCCKKCGGVIDK